MRILISYCAIILSCISGCTSISSTLVNRTDNDMFVGNSNGEPNMHSGARPFKGVPITVRVPTHVDVAIREKVRYYAADNSLTPIKTRHRHLFVQTDLIYTDKVFMVDVKRPAAGTLDYTMEFGALGDDVDNRQYFKSLKSKIEDKTLADVSTAISTVLQAIPTSKDDGQNEEGTNKDTAGVIVEERTVAWKRFDIDAYDFEDQVSLFVDQHMNCRQIPVQSVGTDGETQGSAPVHGSSNPVPTTEYRKATEPLLIEPFQFESPQYK